MEPVRAAKTVSPWPTRKVAASGLAAAITTLVLAALAKWQHRELPPGVGEALVTVISFIVAYLTSPKPGEVVEFNRYP